jgi:hypothetical protein
MHALLYKYIEDGKKGIQSHFASAFRINMQKEWRRVYLLAFYLQYLPAFTSMAAADWEK